MQILSHTPLKQWRHLVAGKLRRQVTLPTLIGVTQLILVAASIARGDAPLPMLVWLVPAFVLGFAIGRATRVVWDSETYQVVLVSGQVVLTLVWLAIQIGSRPLLTSVLRELSFASSLTMLIVAGLVIGHAMALLTRIRQVLPRTR